MLSWALSHIWCPSSLPETSRYQPEQPRHDVVKVLTVAVQQKEKIKLTLRKPGGDFFPWRTRDTTREPWQQATSTTHTTRHLSVVHGRPTSGFLVLGPMLAPSHHPPKEQIKPPAF